MKTLKLTILAILLGCIYSLNAQLKVHSDNTFSISNRALKAGMVNPTTYVNIGAQFIPSKETIAIGNMATTVNVMALTGFNSYAAVGTSSNYIAAVRSNKYYTNGTYLGVLAGSDFNLKTNIRELMPMSEKILKLRPVTYDFVKTGSGEDVSENPFYKNRTGFIAQEVKEVFPDLVVIDENNMHSLDYAGLIPYLTKALQEQSLINQEQEKIIKNLEQQINDIHQGIYEADFIIDGETSQPNKASQKDGTDNALYQNSPNPFNISTTIKYQLSDNTTNAKICIYNLTGKQLQCYNLPATKGENSIEVRASSLQAGMYLYSLIVDDKLIATKRMVLTE